MANAEIVVTRKHGNVFIGVQPLKINFVHDAKCIVLEVEKITSDTYVGETAYTGESFILLDIYPKTYGTVKVTYGGLTKTITDTSGAAEPTAQQVFFGTFNGVSDSSATPASGELVIEGDCRGFGVSKYDDGYCSCITAVKSWGGCKFMPSYMFRGCAGLQSVVMPEGIAEIGVRAFYGCSALNSVTIPASVTNIGLYAFSGCNALGKMTVFATTPPTTAAISLGAGEYTIVVPNGCCDVYKAAAGWEVRADDIVEEE